MTQSKTSIIVPSILGIAAGVVTSIVISRVGRAAPEPTRVVSLAPASSRAQTETARAEDGRLALLERQLAALRAEREQPATDERPRNEAPTPDPASTAEGRTMTPEARREEHAKLVAEADRRFVQDPVDPTWARSATQSLSNSIGGVADHLGYHVLDSECRTQFCRATVEWKSMDEARKNSHELAEMALPGLNCAQSSLLIEPEQEGGPVRTKMFMDCADLRAGRVEQHQ